MDANTLRELLSRYGRKTSLNEGVLQDALDDSSHGTAFKEWTSMHLGPDNLLSKDELALYSSLDQAGLVDELVASQDLATVQALSEDELKTAVQRLDRSTATINKQTEMLKQHQSALAKLVDGNAKLADSRSSLEASRAGRQASDRRKLTSKVEELSQNLSFRTSDLEQQATAIIDGLHQTVDGLLTSDDKLLLSLQKLGWELDPDDPEEKQNVATLRECCLRLIKYTVETTRTKLDRTYLEALESAALHQGSTDPPADDVKALQDEVESLYAEILPVAQMSVEQQYLEPALKSLSDRNGQSAGRSTAAIAYILDCLDYLVDRIIRLEARVAAIQSHRAATTALIETTKTELIAPVAPVRKAPAPQPASPVRPRAPLTTPGPRRRRSSGSLYDEPPIESLLRLLTINLATSSMDPNEAPSLSETIRVLARAQEGRAAKADDVVRNAQESFEHSAVAHLADGRRAIQLLRDSILAESSFGEEVKLVDPEVEGLIIELSQEIAKVQSRVEQAEVERHGITGGAGEKRREFIQRWGR
ncbi:hypothetical protein ACHAQA_008202 [Verticillium albo-atrum]